MLRALLALAVVASVASARPESEAAFRARLAREHAELRRMELELATVRSRAYLTALASINYRPTKSCHDKRRGLGERKPADYGYPIGSRNAPGHIEGIGGVVDLSDWFFDSEWFPW